MRRIADRKERSVTPHGRGRAGERFAFPRRANLCEIVADEKRAAAFAKRVNLARFTLLAADAAFEMRQVR